MLSPLVVDPHVRYTQAAPRSPRPSEPKTSPLIFPGDLHMKGKLIKLFTSRLKNFHTDNMLLVIIKTNVIKALYI